jgi:hypothetical protein
MISITRRIDLLVGGANHPPMLSASSLFFFLLSSLAVPKSTAHCVKRKENNLSIRASNIYLNSFVEIKLGTY